GGPERGAGRWGSVEPGGPAGSSRSTTPSSAATSTATAVASFETDAQPSTSVVAPRAASTRPHTTATARSHGHASIWRSASTRRDTIGVDRQLISSGAAFEERVGYSRAVRVGDRVWVAGTAPIMPEDADPPAGPYEQAHVCIAIIERA